MFGPVRPLLHDEAAGLLYALNTHDSRLLELDAQTGAVLRSVQLPWGPVSVTAWPGDGITPPALLVVSRGSYVLARIDRATLAITALVTLPTEPADVVVEPSSGHAFVACSGADAGRRPSKSRSPR